MVNKIRTGDPRGFNKGCSLKFREGSRVRQTFEEGRRTYRPKHCGNNKDEDNRLKTLNDKNHLCYEREQGDNDSCLYQGHLMKDKLHDTISQVYCQ